MFDIPSLSEHERISAFILENTQLIAPPLVPEVKLHLATEELPIWQKTDDELAALGIPDPYWAFAWAGGQALARYVLDHPEIVTGRAVIDIGSGSGLVAIAAKLSGASRVLAADIDPIAAAAAKLNALANSVECRTTVSDLLADTAPTNADVILLGDLFYDASLAKRALIYCRQAAATGCEVITGDPERAYFPREAFVQAAQYSVPVTRELEDMEIKRTAVWRLKQA